MMKIDIVNFLQKILDFGYCALLVLSKSQNKQT